MNTSHLPTSETIFETGNLLTVNTGALEVTSIPVEKGLDWLIPSSLVLNTQPYDEKVEHYSWLDTKIVVYSKLSGDRAPKTMIVIESSYQNQPIGLIVSGQPKIHQIKISDIKDIELTGIDQADSYVFQAVELADNTYIIPNIQELSDDLINA